MSTPRHILILLALVAAAAVRAQAALPPGGATVLKAEALRSFRLTNAAGDDAVIDTVVNVAGATFARTRWLETKRDLVSAWAVELRAPLERRAQGRGRLCASSRRQSAYDQGRAPITQARPFYPWR